VGVKASGEPMLAGAWFCGGGGKDKGAPSSGGASKYPERQTGAASGGGAGCGRGAGGGGDARGGHVVPKTCHSTNDIKILE
jgi:hypothetical protein